MDAAGLPHRLIMYPPFTPTAQEAAVAPGHLLFLAEGLPIWATGAHAPIRSLPERGAKQLSRVVSRP